MSIIMKRVKLKLRFDPCSKMIDCKVQLLKTQMLETWHQRLATRVSINLHHYLSKLATRVSTLLKVMTQQIKTLKKFWYPRKSKTFLKRTLKLSAAASATIPMKIAKKIKTKTTCRATTQQVTR